MKENASKDEDSAKRERRAARGGQSTPLIFPTETAQSRAAAVRYEDNALDKNKRSDAWMAKTP